MEEKYPLYFKVAFTFLGIFLLFAILIVAKNILIPIALSILFAIVAYPLYSWLRRIRLPNVLAILLSILILFFILGFIIFFLIDKLMGILASSPILLNRLEMIYLNLQDYLETSYGIAPQLQVEYLRNMAKEYIETGMGEIISSLLSKAGNILIAVGVIPIYTFLFLYYRRLFRRFFLRITPNIKNSRIHNFFTKGSKTIQTYIAGVFLVMVILAGLNSVALTIIGISFPVFFGVLAAFLTIIPYFGVFIGTAITVIYAIIVSDNVFVPIAVLVAFNAIQYIEGHLITPRLVSWQVNLNPLAIIIALFLGLMVWGPIGLIIFVPYLAILKIFLESVTSLKPYAKLLSGVKKEGGPTSL